MSGMNGRSGAPQDTKHIVVCCDGTWCGEAMGTTSNTKMFADSFANPTADAANGSLRLRSAHRRPADLKDPSGLAKLGGKYVPETKAHVFYFQGVAVGSQEEISSEEYLLDCVLALSINQRCIEVYEAVVQHFEPGVQIWLFGHSRGAHTVRSVCGMINNCGILDMPYTEGEDPAATLKRHQMCENVYRIYRNADELYKPGSDFSTAFRKEKSHQTKGPPIRFLGILDTVGALGVPKINSGISLSYEFYDQAVSWEVQTVSHMLAAHDRFSPFTPTFARRPKDEKIPEEYRNAGWKASHYELSEVWFPGAHYDCGRQHFRFGRVGGPPPYRLPVPTWAEPLKFALGIPIGEFLFNKAVSGLTQFVANQAELMFDQQIANAAFDWVLTSVQTANSSNPKVSLLLPKPAAHYRDVWNQDGTISRRGVYSKDAYDKIAESVVVGALSSLPGGGVIPVIVAKQALVDRHIPLYEYPPQQPAAIFAYKGSADNGAANELQYCDKSVVATGGYNSRAVTLLAHMREPTPLPTMNVATRKAGPSLQLPAAAQAAAGNTA